MLTIHGTPKIKKEAVPDTRQVLETTDIRADDAGASTFSQDQKWVNPVM